MTAETQNTAEEVSKEEYTHDYDVDVITYAKGQEASGGVRVVVDAIKPKRWFGGVPAKEEVSEELWNVTGGLEGPFGKPFLRKDTADTDQYKTFNVALPKAIREKHYDFANLIPWPEAHEMDIILDSGMTVEDLGELYTDYYLRFNEIFAVNYDNHAEEQGYSGDKNILHSHDYQMMTGGIYSNHTPVSTLAYLENTKLPNRDGKKVALADTPFYRDRIEKYAMNPLSTFQRESDQINMITILNYFDQKDQQMIDSVTKHYSKRIAEAEPEELESLQKEWDNKLKEYAGFAENNPQLFGEGKPLHGLDVNNLTDRETMVKELKKLVSEGQLTQLNYLGKNISLLSVPVGLDVTETLKTAKTSHSKERTFSTVYSGDKRDFLFEGITGKDPETKEYTYASYNPTNLDKGFYPKEGPNKLDPTLDEIFETVDDREIMLALHRNDYTKGTLEILDGVEEFFDDKLEKKEKINQTLFLTLPPTRLGVNGYKETAAAVLDKVKKVKAKYGEKSVVLVPGVNPDDALRLMRKEQVKGFLAPSFRDGYCLTPEEFVAANSDRSGEDLFVVVSDGMGVADYMSDGEKGAHVVKMHDTYEEFRSRKGRKEVSSQIATAIKSGFDPKNKVKGGKNAQNWEFAVSQTKKYDAKHYNKTIYSNYDKSMDWAFEKDPRFPELANDNGKVDWKKIPYKYLIHRDLSPQEQALATTEFPEHTMKNFDRRPFIERVGKEAATNYRDKISYAMEEAARSAATEERGL